MKLSILLCLCLLAQGVFPHMPTFYEFCSHVVANGEGGRATCDASQCQGRPGKVGPGGIQGLKGQKGEQSAEIGPAGPGGIQGSKGQKGEQSAEIGLAGPEGIQGSKGQKGEQSTKIGPAGPGGIQGSKGQKGEQSTQIGPVGPRGIQGLKGQKGEQSAKIGPVGPRGIQGLKGQRGETGTSERLEEKVRILEESLKRIDAMMTYTSRKEAVCYMGMKSGRIPDSAITSSSDWASDWAAHLGRLDNRKWGSKSGTWATGRNRVGEWMQVDLGQPEVVGGVVTQGHFVLGQWVTSYKVSCGNVVNSMTTITDNGRDKIFSANTDMHTKVVNKFPQLMTCRYIRIYPQSFYGHMAMRLEIISGMCKDIY